MIITVESNAHCYCIPKEEETHVVSMSADGDIEEWRTIILSIVVGLVALRFFLALGGIFAFLRPWMIFATIHLVRQKWVRKAGGHLRQQAQELVTSIRIHASAWKIFSCDERASFTQRVCKSL